MQKPPEIQALSKTLSSRLTVAINKSDRLTKVVTQTNVHCRQSSNKGKYDAVILFCGQISQVNFEYPIELPASNQDIDNLITKALNDFRGYLQTKARQINYAQKREKAREAKANIQQFRNSMKD